ncbi:Crp/Fnr family transcriptional regulator [Thermaurantiacus sp.]
MRHEPPALARAIVAGCALKSVERDATIYDSHSGPHGLVGLAQGQIRMEIVAGPADATLFAVVTPGFCLSDMPIPPGLFRPVAAVAQTSCLLLVASPKRLEELAARHPGVEAAVTRLVTINLWTTLGLVSMLRRQDKVEQVATLLCALAGDQLADGHRICTSQGDLASMAAIGRTTLVEALRALESLRLLRVGYRAIEILDSRGLAALRDGEREVRPGWGAPWARESGRLQERER